MSAKFDWSKYEDAEPKEKSSFDWAKYEKKQESSSAGSILGREFTAGVAGTPGDVLNIYNEIRNLVPSGMEYLGFPLPPKIPKAVMPATTHQASKTLQEHTGGREPSDVYERYAESVGRFAGQEAAGGAVIGGVGGPVGALTGATAGTAHGAYAGAIYQTAREFGADDDTAAWITLVASLSPVAIKQVAPKLWDKIKKIPRPKGLEKSIIGEDLPVSKYETAEKAIEEAAKSPIQQRRPGGNEPPPPPPPPPGDSAPSLAGRAVTEELQPFLPPGNQPPPIPMQPAGRSLQGRVQPNIPTPMKGPQPQVPPPTSATEAPSLQGRVSTGTERLRARPEEFSKVLDSPSRIISPSKFHNEAEGGNVSEKMVKSNAHKERAEVGELYKDAEATYASESDIFPNIVSDADRIIEQYSQSAELNTGEKAVLKEVQSIKTMLGGDGGYHEVPLSRLIATSNSMTGMAKFEMPFTGPKELLKSMAKKLNNAVIESLKRKGIDPSKMINADKRYGQWASKFANDEISSFLGKDILNPESLYRKAVSNEGTYRALQRALEGTPHGRATLDKIAREIVEDRLKPFLKDISKVGSEEYNKAIKNLESVIGKGYTDSIDEMMQAKRSLRDIETRPRQPIAPTRITASPKEKIPRPIQTPESVKTRKLPPERITAATQKKPVSSPLNEKQKQKVRETIKKEHKAPTAADSQFVRTVEKIAEYKKMPPEELLKNLKTRTGLKKLRKDLTAQHFDVITRQKMRSALREGNIEHNFPGNSLYKVLNNEENYELFTEIIGREATEAARKVAKVIGKHQMTATAIKDLVKKGIIVAYVGKDVLRLLSAIEKLI